MAWLYMILVLAAFYAFGMWPKLMGSPVKIPNIGLAIPFSEAARPLIYSFLAWYIPWKLTRWIEGRTGFDLFYWVDQRLKRTSLSLQLRRGWLYPERPFLSLNLTGYLARIGLAVSFFKTFGVVLLGMGLTLVLPWLIELALPGLVEYLLGEFAASGLVDTIAGWIAEELIGWLVGTGTGWLQEWISGLQQLDIPPTLPILSILILCAGRAHERERWARYQLDIKRNQRRRKRNQEYIEMPPVGTGNAS